MDRVSFLPIEHAPTAPPLDRPVEDFVTSIAQWLGHSEALVTFTGRAGMSALFQHLGLQRDDEVFITTTFDYPTVSSCVTCTVFNFCKPSRVLGSQARAIFVIHEFGVPHAGTPALRAEASRRGIPLIEDCAHTVSSSAPEGWRVGELGDWVIVSLPKIFPTSRGGLLVGPPVPYAPTDLERTAMATAARTAAAWWPLWPEHADRRRQVYQQLSHLVGTIGLEPLFEATDGITPWFFPVATGRYEEVREAARQHGVDCGLWHGSNVVVLPCHQFLTDYHLNRIAGVVAQGVIG